MKRPPFSIELSTSSAWHGLAELPYLLRAELARELLPIITADLNRFMTETQDYCPGDPARSGNDSEAARYQLRMKAPAILDELTANLTVDCVDAPYPPQYRCWDLIGHEEIIRWTALDHYQADRVTLRNRLINAVNSHPTYSVTLYEAAVPQWRFQNPHWAPWAPLHWFERLFEACEVHLSPSALTIWVMTCYVRHLTEQMESRLERVSELLINKGLVTAHTDA